MSDAAGSRRLAASLSLVLSMGLFGSVAAAEGTKISSLHRAEPPDISNDLVAYFAYNIAGYNQRGIIFSNQGIYVYDKKSKKTHKVAIPILATPTVEVSHPRVAGEFIIWDDYRVDNWDIFACRLDRATGQCPVHQITNNSDTQYLPDVSEEGFIVWDDWRNNQLNPTYGNRDIYGCDYNPATGACPEHQITSNLSNQMLPRVSGRRTVWWDTRHAYQYVYTCLDDPQSGSCPEVQLTTNLGNWNKPRVSQDRILAYLYATTGGDPNALPIGMYLFDLTQPGSQPKLLTGYASDIDVGDEFAVWSDGDIRSYHLSDSQQTRLTVSSGNETMPAVSKGCVAYIGYATGSSQVYLDETLCPPHGPVLSPLADRTVAESETLSVQLAATDEDGDALTYSVSPMPLGSGLDAAAKVFHWTPNYDQAGTYALTASVSDGGLSDSKPFTVMVSNTNRAPLLTGISDKTIAEGQLLTFTLAASDPDGDPVTYSASAAGDLPAGASLGTQGVFSWTPSLDQAGTYFIPLTVSDGSLQDMEGVAITVTNTNQAPVLHAVGEKTVAEGQALSFSLSATDPDTDELTFTMSSLPEGAVFDGATRTLNWTPGFSAAGSYTVTATVSDGSLTDSKTIAITVTNTNQAPIFGSTGEKTIPEGQALSFSLSATDPDRDDLVFSAPGPLPAGASFDPSRSEFSWTPAFGQAGAYSISFAVTDGLLEAVAGVAIVVTHANQAPTIQPVREQMVDEDELLSITLSGADPDGDPLAYAMSSLPAGEIFDAASQTLNWSPTFDQAGNYSLTATVTDAGGLSASTPIAITVMPVNRSPDLLPIGPKTGKEGENLAFTAQATDPDGDPLTFTVHSLPAGASLDSATGAFTWTPSYEQAGSYTAAFIVTDAEGLGDLEEVTLTIENANRPPEFEPIPDKTCKEGERMTVIVSATDKDGEPMTYTVGHNLPGAAFDAWTRTFSWTPGYDQQGNHEVVFTVSDPNGASQAEPVLFTVTNVNRTPGFGLLGNQTVTAGTTLKLTLDASDPDGDKLTYGATGLPKGALFTAATGTFSWTPTTKQLGQYVVTFTVSDGTLTVSKTITITVIKPSSRR